MLKKWVSEKSNKPDHYETPEQPVWDRSDLKSLQEDSIERREKQVNTILKGCRITGDITLSCDLVLNGDVEGNITSHEDSNITVKGSCKGNIRTKGGNVDIQGELRGGSIFTGGNVSITGKFKGGEVNAKGKIFANSEFKGKLDGNELEIGPNAKIKGELFYKEFITIARGAKVEVHLCCVREDERQEKKLPQKKEASAQVAEIPVAAGEGSK